MGLCKLKIWEKVKNYPQSCPKICYAENVGNFFLFTLVYFQILPSCSIKLEISENMSTHQPIQF